jgi:hypothetical protein
VKKILFLAMMIALFILPVVGFADNTAKDEVKLDDFEITTPEKEESLVTTDSMVLTGIGKEFDSINIDVYSVKKNKNKEIKVLTESYEFEVDSLKVFAQDLQLKEGLNYITVLVNRDSKKYSFTKKVIFDKKLNFIKTLDYTKNKK